MNKKFNAEESEVLQGDSTDEEKLKDEVPVENQNLVSGTDELGYPENNQKNGILP